MKRAKKKHDPTKERWLSKVHRNGERVVIRDNEHNDWPMMYSPVAELFSTPEDATLAAAAPELYAALFALVATAASEANEAKSISGDMGARISDARAALAKARGKS